MHGQPEPKAPPKTQIAVHGQPEPKAPPKNAWAAGTESTPENTNSNAWAAAAAASDIGANESRNYTLYPHFLNNITFGKQIEQPTGIFTVELKIENLFNESYRNVLMRFMPGRSFTLNLKYDF